MRPFHAYRGTRRNLPFARGLLATAVGGAFLIGATLGLGLWTSFHSGQDAIGLMTVQVGGAEVLGSPNMADEAPSRVAPESPPVTIPTRSPSLNHTPVALPADTPAAVDDEGVVMFDGRPLRKVKTLRMTTTAYSPDERSCGIWADGFTASGYSVWTNAGKLVAADTDVLPFGSIVSIPGYHGGRPVPVLDRGGAIKGHRLDLLYPTHEVALQWGVQHVDVDVWEYAD